MQNTDMCIYDYWNTQGDNETLTMHEFQSQSPVGKIELMQCADSETM